MTITVWDYLLGLDGPTNEELATILNESEELEELDRELGS